MEADRRGKNRRVTSADELATAFEAHRPYLRSLAYGTLGSLADADDVVQEAWLRLERADPGEIRDLRAWLATVVGRLALDALGSARRRRERYVGPWLPEPLVEARVSADPADRVTLDERVTTALLIVLERLSPAERTAFVLHDVFGFSFDQVGEIVGRAPPAARQLASRARKHVAGGTPRFPASRDEQERLVSAFAAAAEAGDVDALLGVLDARVTLRADGGGKATAARQPLVGAERVGRLVLTVARKFWTSVAPAMVNGAPGLVVDDGGTAPAVFSFTVDAGRIVAIDIVRNPDKLHHVPAPRAITPQ
jgi:RNA polymerase sigma factor (sigma-70 family)